MTAGAAWRTQKRRMRQNMKTPPITVLNAFEDTVLARQQISRHRLVHTLRKQSSGVGSITTGAAVASNSYSTTRSDGSQMEIDHDGRSGGEQQLQYHKK
jgi:hypothetical protein